MVGVGGLYKGGVFKVPDETTSSRVRLQQPVSSFHTTIISGTARIFSGNATTSTHLPSPIPDPPIQTATTIPPSPPPQPRVDYYALLAVPRDASDHEITRAWRALVLQHHPDKQAGRTNRPDAPTLDIRLVNEAKWVLGDPGRRREWDEAFFNGRTDQVQVVVPSHPHIFHEISLELFTPHYADTSPLSNDTPPSHAEDQAELDPQPQWYSHPCRCSGEFVITHQDLEDGVEVVGCEGCGEWVRVGYEVVEESDGENGVESGKDAEGAEGQTPG